MSRVGFAKILTHTLTFLCFYLATIWSLVTAFTPEFSSRQQKSKGRGAKLFIPFFTHFCIHIFSYISCLLILFVAISLSCSFALCPCFLVNVSNSLLFVNLFVHSFLLLTCFVHGQEAEANASLALWRFFGRRGSGHRTCSFVSPSRFTSNFSNFSNCNSLFYFRNFTLYTLYLPRHNLIHRLFHSISYPLKTLWFLFDLKPFSSAHAAVLLSPDSVILLTYWHPRLRTIAELHHCSISSTLSSDRFSRLAQEVLLLLSLVQCGFE